MNLQELPFLITQLCEDIAFIKKQLLIPGTDQNQPQEEILTVPQSAEFLSLSIQTIYTLVSKRQIPFMKKGKRIYFSKTELIEYLKSGRKQTLSQMSENASKFLGNVKKKGGQHE